MKHLARLIFMPVLSLGLSLGICSAQDKADPIADIKALLKEPTKPFTLIVEFKVKPDSLKEFKALAREAVKNTRMEPGNASYQIHADAQTPTTLIFFEIWRSVEALEAHVKQEYTTKLLGSAEAMCEGKPTIRVLTPVLPPVPAKPPAKPAATPAAPQK